MRSKTGLPRFLVIADDFTGANDTGVQLARAGFDTCVLLRPDGVQNDTRSYVLDTQSRALPVQQAVDAVRRAIGAIALEDFTYVIKKIDSTLRGHIAQEVLAVDQMFGSDLVLCMPALPDLGRTTQQGVQHLHGVPLLQTELRSDPQTPVTEDHLPRLLQSVYEREVALLSLAQVRSGAIDLGTHRVYVCDAVTNADMQTVVAAALASGKRRILWVGSAAIADRLMAQTCPVAPSLALVASVSDVTRRQVAYARQAGACWQVVPVERHLDGQELSEIVAEACQTLSQGRDVIVLSSATASRDALQRTWEAGQRLGLSPQETGRRTQRIMGELARQILGKQLVSGLLLSGGDTALGVLQALGAAGSRVLGEAAIGMPYLRIEGGRYHGLPAITKAGAFGQEDAIAFGLRKLREMAQN